MGPTKLESIPPTMGMSDAMPPEMLPIRSAHAPVHPSSASNSPHPSTERCQVAERTLFMVSRRAECALKSTRYPAKIAMNTGSMMTASA